MAINTLCRTLNYFRYTQVIPSHLNVINRFKNNQRLSYYLKPQWTSFSVNFCSDSSVAGIEEPVKTKKKKVYIPRITLLYENDEMAVMTLEQAEKIALRRDMKLVKIVDYDNKSERPVYKLMGMKQFIEQEKKSKAVAKAEKEKQLKEDKTITVSSKIAEHDLAIKIKSMHKMFKKKHGVRVIIAVDNNMQIAEAVADEIIKGCEEFAKVLTKSGTAVKLQIIMRPDLEKILKSNEPVTDENEENKVG